MDRSIVVVLLVLFPLCGLAESADTKVKINGEEYTPAEPLSEVSPIVEEGKDEILDKSDLYSFVNDLRRLARFMRIAYNGMKAAGTNYTDLQIEIQLLGYNITDLYDKTARTLKKFNKTSKNIVTKRRTAYLYLMDGLDEMASEALSSLAHDAREMSRAALELYDGYNRMAEEFIKTLVHTQTTQTKQERHLNKLKLEHIKMEETKREQERVAEEAEKIKERAARKVEKYTSYENENLMRMNSYPRYIKNFMKDAVNFVFGRWYTIPDDGVEENVKMFHDWSLKQLQLEAKERELQNEALGLFRDALLRIAEIDAVFESEENIAGAVADALHLSVGALRNLSDIMKHAANIWKNFEDEFLYLAQLRKPMDTALEYSSDKRLAIWTSDPFKEDFVRDSAQWLAMHVVCREVGEEVKRTQHELHGYIRENPTKEESRSVMKHLANELLTDIEKEQKDSQAVIEDLRQKQEVGEDPRPKPEVGEDLRQKQEVGEDHQEL